MKNRKIIIALLLVAIVGIVGLTFAYFSNSSTVENEFNTLEYGATYTEEFVSPDNWLPGDTTNKTIIATNTGETDEAVRIHVSEAWTTHNNGTLNGWIHSDGTKSTHTTSEELASDERVAILNLANTSDWTKVGDYYYYNYKLAPGESTTSFLESVTFNSKTKLDDTCTTTTNNGVTTTTCNSSGDDYDDATYKLTLTVETVQYNQYTQAWNTGNTVTIANTSKPAPETASEYLATNATNSANTEYNATTKGKMFTFTHTLNEGTENETTVTESRYIGDAPNNYVKFNCDNDGTNCEVWRILGVFDVDDGTGNVEQRMKLVRGSDFATTMVFNSNSNNDWTVSPLNTFLNGDYYNRTGEAATYGLKASAKSMVDDAVYYLGAIYNFGNTEKIYGEERGTTVCGACNSDTTKLTWTGKVGLMYTSDEYMVYGNEINATCYDNPMNCNGSNATTGWVFNSNIKEGQSYRDNTWLLASYADTTDAVLLTFATGFLSSSFSSDSYGIRPVVYLKSSVKITGGTGEAGSPYVLEEMQ